MNPPAGSRRRPSHGNAAGAVRDESAHESAPVKGAATKGRAEETPERRTRLGRLAGYLYQRFARLDQEMVGAVWLDARRRVIDVREVFRGTLHSATVESRPILRVALELQAATVIVFHIPIPAVIPRRASRTWRGRGG
jgi:DNA repair protein RadC